MSMKHLFAAAAVAPLCFAASAGFAQTTISDGTTAQVSTSTTGDLSVTGQINTKVPGPAITVNSNNTVTITGNVTITDQTSATGVLVVGDPAGRVSGFSMTGGLLSTTETVKPIDSNGDGNIDGPFVGSPGNPLVADPAVRYGLRVTGPGTFTGDIIQSGGSIGAQGNGGSAAISIEAPVIGTVSVTGQVSVLGDNTFGIVTTAPITGNVTIGGTLSAQGGATSAVSLGGAITGKLLLNGTVTNTGYRYPTRSTTQAFVDKLGADDLLQGGPAVKIGNSVSGGVWFYLAPTASSTNTDVDSDGILDSTELTSSTISQYGSAPAILIGGSGAITLGVDPSAAAVNAYGLILAGTVSAGGIYDNNEAHGVLIGGQGGAVTIVNGIEQRGTITASSVLVHPKTVAGLPPTTTALELGNLTATPLINNSGTITTAVANTAIAADAAPQAYGIRIDAGAATQSLVNIGNINVGISGTYGVATAVSDQSGSLTSITNSGTISAAVSTGDVDIRPATTPVALDLRSNTTQVTVNQVPNTTVATTPAILGAVLFGSGDATLNIQAGSVVGGVAFGTGINTLDVASGAFVGGAITNAGTNLTAQVDGGLAFTNTGPVQMTSLAAGPSSTVRFAVGQAAGATVATQLEVAGPVTFNTGSTLSLGFNAKLPTPAGDPLGVTTLTLVNASGGITGGNVASLGANLPYLYQGSLANTGNQLQLTVGRRSAAQMGLTGASAAAFEAFYSAFDKDPTVAAIVLSKDTQANFNKIYNQFLPDYSGGPFNSMASGVRAIQRTQSEQAVDMDQSEPRSWLQEVGFGVRQTSNTSEIGYDTAGFAVAAGYEQPAGKLGTVGYSAAILTSDISDDNRAFGSKLSASAVVGSFYWRKAAGGLLLDASATGAGAWFDSVRRVVDADSTGAQNLVRNADATYYGAMGGVRFGAAYEAKFGAFYIRPEATLDYLYLYEGGYTEQGGGPSIDLKVDSRSSSNATAEAGVILGARFGRSFHWGPELQVAYRSTLAGSLGSTRAEFVSMPGGAFLLPALPVDRNRLLVRLALRGSGAYANFALEGSGEFGDLYDEYTGRIVVRFIF